jgi:hypothetical protein
MFVKTAFKTPPNRAAVLSRVYRGLYESIGLANGATAHDQKWAEPMVAHPLLLRILQSDPSVCAILPTVRVPIALGLSEHAPFLINQSGLLSLPPVLLGSSSALAATTRWGLEAARFLRFRGTAAGLHRARTSLHHSPWRGTAEPPV